MGGWLIKLWSEWVIQIMVMLSLALQVALVLFAGIRRREASWSVSRLFLWLAYQGADNCAIYVLGQISLQDASRDHQLAAFWAPFLLVHLGGPDNITAYTLEDSKLWLRHLPTIFMQVLGAAYVIYKHILGTDNLLLVAAVLMYIVGVFKYGERIWALRRNNMDTIQSSVKKEPRAKCHFYLEDKAPPWWSKGNVDEEEFLMRHAHSIFHICKHAMVSSSEVMESYHPELNVFNDLTDKQKYVLMEMELSLMYDILYTKTSVIHTLFGYSICIFSLMATATTFLLFQFSGSDRHNRIDVAITYVLLAGALLLEIRLVLNALGSSWTFPFLCSTRWTWLRHAVLCGGTWGELRRGVVSLHRLVKIMGLGTYLRSAKRWSGTIGQYDMLQRCTHPSKRKKNGGDGSMSPWDSPLVGRLAKVLGLEDWWDKKYYSVTIDIPKDLKVKLLDYINGLVNDGGVSTQGVIRNSWGETPLVSRGLYGHFKDLLGVEFQEGIIILHIATGVILTKNEAKGEEALGLMEAIRVMSNYLMFLLVNQPHMLPGLDQSKLYQTTCRNLKDIWPAGGGADDVPSSLFNLFRLHDDPDSRSRLADKEKLADILLTWNKGSTTEIPRLSYVGGILELHKNQHKLKHKHELLQLFFELWADFLAYAANRCSRESHAKKLSSGGEFTTILWLLIEHFHKNLPPNRRP